MVQVFCGAKGSGKTKALIEMANEKVESCGGHIVYLDDDNHMSLRLNKKIRFISTQEFEFENFSNFYGLVCGIISQDYDIDTVFVDGLINIAHSNIEEANNVFNKLEHICSRTGINFYINVSCSVEECPDFLKKYLKN